MGLFYFLTFYSFSLSWKKEGACNKKSETPQRTLQQTKADLWGNVHIWAGHEVDRVALPLGVSRKYGVRYPREQSHTTRGRYLYNL